MDRWRRHTGGIAPEERWKAGTAAHSLRRESLDSATVFHPLIRSRSLSLMTAVRRTQLARLGVWIGLATVAVLTAVLTARTETGIRRIATLLSPAAGRAGAQRQGPRPADRATASSTRRRNSAVSARRSARSRPTATGSLARLNTLERNIEDVTGSIGPGRARRRNCRHPGRSLRRSAPAAPRRLPQRQVPLRRKPLRRPRPSQPESRRGRPPRDQQPDGRRIGRHQDRVRRRSRRQCHDRRPAHHVVEPEGDASPRCWKGSAP